MTDPKRRAPVLVLSLSSPWNLSNNLSLSLFYRWTSKNLSLEQSQKAKKWKSLNLNPYLSCSRFFIHWDNKPAIFLKPWITRLMIIIKKYFSRVGFVPFFPKVRPKENLATKRRLAWKMRCKAFCCWWNFLKVLKILKLALLGVLFNMHVTVDKVSAGRNHTILTAGIWRT